MTRLNHKLSGRLAPANDADPREGMGAEIVDLATRNVMPSVSQRKPTSDGLGLAAGVAIVALLGGLTLWRMESARTAPQPPTPAVNTPRPLEVNPDPPAPVIPPVAQPAYVRTPPLTGVTTPAGNPNQSPTVLFDASALPASAFSPAVSAPSAAAAPTNSNEDFLKRLGGEGGGEGPATVMVDPKTTVTQGTLIPAVLETAIDTDVPGYARAMVTADVRSFDGSRVLVPRSSRLVGQYKSGLQAGQRRAYVIWTRLIRPDGVSVNLGSPAVTFSGETGLPGEVDSRFFERFGSSMLLSVVGGLSTLGGSSRAGVIVAGSGQSAAATAVGQTGQIGPTVRVRQGEPIRVFTARDLDFSKVNGG